MRYPMSKISIINSLIEEKYKPSNQYVLEEEDFDSKGKKFSVVYPIVQRNSQIDFSLYRFTDSDFPYFKNVKDLKRMCDYILFVEENNKLFIFVIELKLSNDSARKQLNAAIEFTEFLIKSAKRVGFEMDNYVTKKIRICDSKVTKKNNHSKADDRYKFDKDNYLDYQVSRSFFIEPLL